MVDNPPRLDRPPAVNPASLSVEDLARLLSAGGGRKITPEQIQLDIDAGAPVGPGGRMSMTLTPGHRGDCPQAAGLLAGLQRGTVGHVIADTAYDSDTLRQQIRALQAGCCIKPNPTRKVQKHYDKKRYKHRNVIERFFCRIRRCRRVATRYEQKAQNFAGFVYLAAFITTED